ncbi:hypothetical protein JCM11641_000862 [Rhodosporidiobolus odoratus]
MVKRESLSPPPPPRPRHPRPTSLDQDELDCLPALPSRPASSPVTSKRAAPTSVNPRLAERSRPSLPASPTSLQLDQTPSLEQSARKRSAASIQTPSASPQNSVIGRRIPVEQEGEENSTSTRSRSSPIKCSPTRKASAETEEQKKRRKLQLKYKDKTSTSGGKSSERENRAKLRAEQAEESRRRRDSPVEKEEEEDRKPVLELRGEEDGDPPSSSPPSIAVVKKQPPSKPRRLPLSRSSAPEVDEVFVEVKLEPDLDAAMVFPPAQPQPRTANRHKSRSRQTVASSPLASTTSPTSPAAKLPDFPPPSSQPQSAPPPPPPSVSTFLSTLPLPTLSRLIPLFSSLGLATHADLLQLASPTEAARRARERVWDRLNEMDQNAERAGGKAGSGFGLTMWERITLEEEMGVFWTKWAGGKEQK